MLGTVFSAEYSTQNPKQIRTLPYTPGGEQAWRVTDVPYKSAYPTISGSIFEFGFSDAILQMWAAFVYELTEGKALNRFAACVTPEETALSHALFTAALESQVKRNVVAIPE